MFKKVFMDTNILSDIGRMNESDRNQLAYDILVNYHMQIIISTYALLELEKCPDKNVIKNVYDFLQISFVGFAKSSYKVFKEELTNNNLEISEYNCSLIQQDKNGNSMNFLDFKNKLFKNITFNRVVKENEMYMKIVQQFSKPVPNIKDYFNLMILNHLYENNIKDFDYNLFPAFTVWSYSLAHKIESKGLKKKYYELDDVTMSYIAPYVDIVIAEKKQINLYIDLKNNLKIKKLENIIFKKHSEIIIEGKFLIDNIFKN